MKSPRTMVPLMVYLFISSTSPRVEAFVGNQNIRTYKPVMKHHANSQVRVGGSSIGKMGLSPSVHHHDPNNNYYSREVTEGAMKNGIQGNIENGGKLSVPKRIMSIAFPLAMTIISPKMAHATTMSTVGFASSTSSLASFFRTTGLVANSVVIGVPIWVFFLQAPYLFKLMGRDKFLYPMMNLTELLFRWTLPIFSFLALASSVVVDNSWWATAAFSPATKAAGVSLLAILVNSLYIVPKALEAGKKHSTKDDKSKNVTDFAVNGGSKTNTKALHQSVVVFTLLHVLGATMHLFLQGPF